MALTIPLRHIPASLAHTGTSHAKEGGPASSTNGAVVPTPTHLPTLSSDECADLPDVGTAAPGERPVCQLLEDGLEPGGDSDTKPLFVLRPIVFPC